MNVRILTFMKIEVGKTMEVVKELQKIPDVVEIDYITGAYDLVVILEAESPKKLHTVFYHQIDRIPAIISSSSNLLIKRWIK